MATTFPIVDHPARPFIDAPSPVRERLLVVSVVFAILSIMSVSALATIAAMTIRTPQAVLSDLHILLACVCAVEIVAHAVYLVVMWGLRDWAGQLHTYHD